MVKILVFDTETTGLPPKLPGYNYSISKDEWKNTYANQWPSIVQLSYIVYDTETNKDDINDIYINLPEDLVSKILGDSNTHIITKTAINESMCKPRMPIKEALEKFMKDYNSCEICVAHNASFDKNMLLAEMMKLSSDMDAHFDTIFESNKIYCTMISSTNVVKIYYPEKYDSKKPMYKPPKLKEAYYVLFGYAPIEAALHNALIDIVACLRVFYRLWFLGVVESSKNINRETKFCGEGEPDIYGKDSSKRITEIINSITPEGISPNGKNNLFLCKPISLSVVTYGIDNSLPIDAAVSFFNSKSLDLTPNSEKFGDEPVRKKPASRTEKKDDKPKKRRYTSRSK
jgi:DNA polymerase III epsilon subunit-like protein